MGQRKVFGREVKLPGVRYIYGYKLRNKITRVGLDRNYTRAPNFFLFFSFLPVKYPGLCAELAPPTWWLEYSSAVLQNGIDHIGPQMPPD